MKMEMVNFLFILDKIDIFEFSNLESNVENLNSEKYMISKFRFIETILEKYRIYKNIERNKIANMFKEYDDNKDGVLQLNEFQAMIKHIAPSMTMRCCTRLFREVLINIHLFYRLWMKLILKILMK